MSSIGERLSKLRAAAGISQGEFARRLGFSQSYVSRIERDLVMPTLENADKMARFLGRDVSCLLYDDPSEQAFEQRLAADTLAFLNYIGEQYPRLAYLIGKIKRHHSRIPAETKEFGIQSVQMTLELVAASLPEDGESGKGEAKEDKEI